MAGRVKHAQRSHRSYQANINSFGSFARSSAAHAQVRTAKKAQGLLASLKNMIHKSQAK